ncbi:MAG TPA: PAS domain S-box protein, partial [Methanomassiliicoccales archaeon]|nr:PAS domain S-box protein [Methanomassiliicoccales archaeon]
MSERLSDGHIRVLIVDDESNLLELARLFLERSMDIKADGATSGEMALQMMRGTVYDVVVSDYQMPSMDGLQLLQALKFYGSDVPFILFTGKGREDIAVAALNLGAAFYLQKGGDPKTQFAELSNMVRRAAVNRTAEKRLVESEDKFRTIFQESPDIYLLIRDGVIIDCNRAAETQFGMPRNEIIGKTPCDLSPPMQPNGASSKELVYHLINKVGSSGSTKFEWLHRRSNGTDFYSDICLMPLKMSGEGFLIATIRDITSRKIAESQLRASEEMFRSVVTSTDAISFVVDSNGTISLLEGKGLARLGLEPGSMVGRNASGLFIGIDSMHLGLKEAAAGNMVRFETDYRDMRYDVVLTPLRREDGEVAHIIGIANDITERAMIDQEREQNSMRIQALRELNQMSDRPLNELAAFAMERAVRLTNSSIGYIAFVNEDESVLSMHAWSKEAMSECMVEDGPFDYPVARTGLWGEAVRQRRPIITNDYAAPNQLEKDIPGGHVRLRRHMNVPVFDKGRIVIVAGVGNKQKDYDLTDVRELTLLMEGMWRLVRRKRAEDALRESDKR